jgi:hypothetical protein
MSKGVRTPVKRDLKAILATCRRRSPGIGHRSVRVANVTPMVDMLWSSPAHGALGTSKEASMRRDDDLIRQLMLDLETANEGLGDDHPVDGFTRDQVAYHLALILKSGLAEGPAPTYYADNTSTTVPNAVFVFRLTPEGHDFIDTLRDDTIWHKVKESSKKVGGSLTLELLKQLGTSIMKAQLGLS